VEKIISPYIKNYWIEKEIDNPVKVSSLSQAVNIKGDSFYGVDELVEFSTINNRLGEVRRTLRQGTGAMYRNRKEGFIVGLNVNNRWIYADIAETDKVLSIK
jgi:hypothetical protein